MIGNFSCNLSGLLLFEEMCIGLASWRMLSRGCHLQRSSLVVFVGILRLTASRGSQKVNHAA